MDVRSGMLLGKWSCDRNVLDLLLGENGARVILEASVRAAAGTKLRVDGQEMTVQQSGSLSGLRPKQELRFLCNESVQARIDYRVEENRCQK